MNNKKAVAIDKNNKCAVSKPAYIIDKYTLDKIKTILQDENKNSIFTDDDKQKIKDGISCIEKLPTIKTKELFKSYSNFYLKEYLNNINKNKNVSSLSNAALFRSVEQAETYINSSTVKEMYTKFHIINLTMELESINKSFSVGEHSDIISIYKELSSDKESIHAIMAKQKQKQIEKAIKIMQEEKQNNPIQKNTENNNSTFRKKRKL